MAVKPMMGTSKKQERRKKKGTLTLGILERMQEEEQAKKQAEIEDLLKRIKKSYPDKLFTHN